MPSALHRRALGTIVSLAAAATLALTGCAATTDTPSGPAAEDGAFPVTLTDVYGETTITEKPERIVTIGWAAQDVVAALGTVPVGITDFTWGTVDTYLPWFEEKVDELGGELPEILQYAGDEIDFEQVLSLQPDLILGVHSGLSENEYKRLGEIAPTIAFADAPWTSDWQELTRTVGAAMGQPDEAEALIDDTNAVIAATAEAHPEFAETTLTYGWYLSEGATALDFYTEMDPRVQLMEQLGFKTSPQVIELGDEIQSYYGGISLEELDTVESDFHLGWIDTPADLERTITDPLVARWAPIAAGNYYFMDDQALAWASSQPSVLSIPWSIDTLAADFSAAIGK